MNVNFKTSNHLKTGVIHFISVTGDWIHEKKASNLIIAHPYLEGFLVLTFPLRESSGFSLSTPMHMLICNLNISGTWRG